MRRLLVQIVCITEVLDTLESEAFINQKHIDALFPNDIGCRTELQHVFQHRRLMDALRQV